MSKDFSVMRSAWTTALVDQGGPPFHVGVTPGQLVLNQVGQLPVLPLGDGSSIKGQISLIQVDICSGTKSVCVCVLCGVVWCGVAWRGVVWCARVRSLWGWGQEKPTASPPFGGIHVLF